MKLFVKIALVVLLFTLITSCFKTRRCECVNEDGKIVYSYGVAGALKKKASKKCQAYGEEHYKTLTCNLK